MGADRGPPSAGAAGRAAREARASSRRKSRAPYPGKCAGVLLINDEITRLDARIESSWRRSLGLAPACTTCGLIGGGPSLKPGYRKDRPCVAGEGPAPGRPRRPLGQASWPLRAASPMTRRPCDLRPSGSPPCRRGYDRSRIAHAEAGDRASRDLVEAADQVLGAGGRLTASHDAITAAAASAVSRSARAAALADRDGPPVPAAAVSVLESTCPACAQRVAIRVVVSLLPAVPAGAAP